jgi:hypothetical protein
MPRAGGVAVACVAFVAACGGRAAQTSDGGAPDGEDPDAPTVEVAEAGATAPEARPLPPDARPPVRLLTPPARLAGNGATACTHQVPPSGDGHRWCAFSLAADGSLVGELWVVDVTVSATEGVPPCDGTSPSCRRLTGTLAVHSVPQFYGDTLVYATDPLPDVGTDFLGPISAWRPGWSAGRQISSNRGFTCIGQIRTAAAACFGEPGGDPAKRDSAEVRVGALLDEKGGILPAIGRFPLRNDENTAWQTAFSPDGATFVLSDADAIGKKQTLRTWPVATAAETGPTVAVDDAESWAISNDAARIYFVRGLPQRADLWVAAFPAGGGERQLEEGIHGYGLVGGRAADQALWFNKDSGHGGSYRLLASPGDAAPVHLFDYEDFLERFVLSLDLRYTAWLDSEFRGVLIRNADRVTCPLDLPGEKPVFDPVFLESAGLMFWQEKSPEHPGFYASTADCRARRPLGNGVTATVPVGDQGVLMLADRDLDKGTSSLDYWAVSSSGTDLDPRGPVRIQRGLERPPALVGPAPSLLVYEATGPTAAETGTFLFGPVPLP